MSNCEQRFQSLADEFHTVAENPASQFRRYLSEGRKVVGCVPEYTPVELIHSLGFIPFGVWGGNLTVARARRYFPTFICGILQTGLELGIMGAFEGMSAICIPNLCDALKAMGQNWKYAVPGIPFIPMTYPQVRDTPGGRAFTEASYRRVATDLTAVGGREFDDATLEQSLSLYNRHNHAMRDFDEIASHHDQVSCQLRHDVFKSAFFEDVEEHTQRVEDLNSTLKALPEKTDRTRIITSGILCDHPRILEILDSNGLAIVGDDVAAESRQYRVDASRGSTAMDKLVDKFARMGCCSTLYDPLRQREQLLVSLAQERAARGVVVFMTKFCDPEEFEYPGIRRALTEAGIANVVIEIDRQTDQFDQAETALETFVDMLALD